MKAAIRTVSLFLPESRSNALLVPTTLFLLSAAPKHPRVVMDQASENSCKRRRENDIPTGSQLYSDQIMPHILNLYGACAKAQDFEIYATHATFEDPLMCAHGVKQIKSAFNSLSKVFSDSRIVEYTINEKVTSPGNNQGKVIGRNQLYLTEGRDIVDLKYDYV